MLISQSSDIPPEKLQMLMDIFALADCDGSGAIDANELGKLLSKFGGEIPEAEVEAMMKAVDTDGSGTITLDELCVMMGPHLKDMGSRDVLKPAFAYIDTNGSGSVSQAEIKELLGKLALTETVSDEKLALLFNEVDPRGAGEIDFEKFVELFTNGGLASKELSHAINLLCTVQTARRILLAVTGFARWSEVKEPAPHASTAFIFDYLCEKLANRLPPLRGMAAVNGTMPGFAKACSQHLVPRLTDAFFRGAGQVVFANNPLSGVFIVAALFAAVADGASPAVAVCGVLGLFGATVAAVLLRMDRNALQSGLFGYNGCLAGLGAATFLVGAADWSAGVLVISALLGALTAVLNLSLGNFLVPTFRTPPFTLAFNVVNWTFVLAAAKFSRFQQAPFLEPTLFPADSGAFSEEWPCCSEFGWVLNSALVSVGQIFLCESSLSGALIIAGVIFCSRILALSLYGGALAGVLIALTLGAPVVEVEKGLWGYDASLGAAAVMTFFYPNRQSSVMSLVCVALCVLLDGAFKAMSAPLGMPVGTVPFCLAAIAMMLTHGGVPGFEPVPIADVSTAEDHLYAFGDESVERKRLLL